MTATKTRPKKKSKARVSKRMAESSKRAERDARRAKKLDEAGDAVLAGNAPLARTLVDEAADANPTDTQRMVRLRELRAKERELSVDLDSTKEHYKKVKADHAATVAAMVRAVDEPLQPSLFDKEDPAPRSPDEIERELDAEEEPNPA